MSRRHLPLLLASSLILSGCAVEPPVPPKIERLSAEQLEASLPQPAAALPLEQIVDLARQGVGAEELIKRIKESGSRYRLSASRIVELARQGVPLAVLDQMVSAERTHIFDDMAGQLERRDKACRERIEQEVGLCRSQMMGPMWFPGPHPFGGCYPMAPGSPFWRCL